MSRLKRIVKACPARCNGGWVKNPRTKGLTQIPCSTCGGKGHVVEWEKK